MTKAFEADGTISETAEGKRIRELETALREAREELASCEKVRRIESQSHDRKLREAREDAARGWKQATASEAELEECLKGADEYLKKEVERLRVYHTDDEPSWRHRAEKAEQERDAAREEAALWLAEYEDLPEGEEVDLRPLYRIAQRKR
jgi:hypothetical protein